jgi:hypothetical protein
MYCRAPPAAYDASRGLTAVAVSHINICAPFEEERTCRWQPLRAGTSSFMHDARVAAGRGKVPPLARLPMYELQHTLSTPSVCCSAAQLLSRKYRCLCYSVTVPSQIRPGFRTCRRAVLRPAVRQTGANEQPACVEAHSRGRCTYCTSPRTSDGCAIAAALNPFAKLYAPRTHAIES